MKGQQLNKSRRFAAKKAGRSAFETGKWTGRTSACWASSVKPKLYGKGLKINLCYHSSLQQHHSCKRAWGYLLVAVCLVSAVWGPSSSHLEAQQSHPLLCPTVLLLHFHKILFVSKSSELFLASSDEMYSLKLKTEVPEFQNNVLISHCSKCCLFCVCLLFNEHFWRNSAFWLPNPLKLNM